MTKFEFEKPSICKRLKKLAGGQGVEPLFTESESVVLPLNDPPMYKYLNPNFEARNKFQ